MSISTLKVFKDKAKKFGSCNFCNQEHVDVFVVRSNNKNSNNVEIRFCSRCLCELKLQTNPESRNMVDSFLKGR